MAGTSQGIRIGVGCAAAAWASMIIPTACGSAEGEGEIVSLQPIERALCEKVVACGCGDAFAEFGAAPPLDCEGWSLDEMLPTPEEGYYYAYGDDYGESYEALPTSIDEQCVQRIAQRIDGLDCEMFFSDASEDCHEYCSLVTGPRLEGQSCASQQQCGRGLRCHHGECTDACAVRPPAEGDPCESSAADCGADLVCVTDGEERGVCAGLPLVGAACPEGRCATGASCGDDGVCFEPAADGEPCMGHRECASRYCPAGYCDAAPAANQPCGANDACAPGSECVFEEDRAVCRSTTPQECGLLLDTLLQVAEFY